MMSSEVHSLHYYAPVNPFPMDEARLPRMVKLDLLLAPRKSLFLLIVGVSLIGMTTSVSTKLSGIWKVSRRALRGVDRSTEGTCRVDEAKAPRRLLSLEGVRSGVGGRRGDECAGLSSTTYLLRTGFDISGTASTAIFFFLVNTNPRSSSVTIDIMGEARNRVLVSLYPVKTCCDKVKKKEAVTTYIAWFASKGV